MADNEQTGATEETSETPVVEQAEGAENENTEETPEESAEDTKEQELPEWARKELERVRKEAADRRVANRDLQKALEGAKTPEEVEALTKEYTDKIGVLEKTILVNSVATKYDLPEALAARLKGDTAEELEADAKLLAQFAVTEEPDVLRGGLNPSASDGETFDPVAASRKARTRRY